MNEPIKQEKEQLRVITIIKHFVGEYISRESDMIVEALGSGRKIVITIERHEPHEFVSGYCIGLYEEPQREALPEEPEQEQSTEPQTT
jgi:hypothetical protein